MIDSFFGGATAVKADELVRFAGRAGVARLVAISSTDVYRYCIEAGLNGGYGLTLLPTDSLPLTEDSPLQEPDPTQQVHDNVRMEDALRSSELYGTVSILRLRMVYGRFADTREAGLVAKVKAGKRYDTRSSTNSTSAATTQRKLEEAPRTAESGRCDPLQPAEEGCTPRPLA